MEPIKIAGLTLKSEIPSDKEREEDAIINDSDPTFADTTPEKNTESNEVNVSQEIPDRELTIQEDLISILKRVEALERTDNTIKAIGKLQGAIELLKN